MVLSKNLKEEILLLSLEKKIELLLSLKDKNINKISEILNIKDFSNLNFESIFEYLKKLNNDELKLFFKKKNLNLFNISDIVYIFEFYKNYSLYKEKYIVEIFRNIDNNKNLTINKRKKILKQFFDKIISTKQLNHYFKNKNHEIFVFIDISCKYEIKNFNNFLINYINKNENNDMGIYFIKKLLIHKNNVIYLKKLKYFLNKIDENEIILSFIYMPDEINYYNFIIKNRRKNIISIYFYLLKFYDYKFFIKKNIIKYSKNNIKNKFETTILHLAFQYFNIYIIKLLILMKKELLFLTDKKNKYPLDYFNNNNNYDIFLLDKKIFNKFFNFLFTHIKNNIACFDKNHIKLFIKNLLINKNYFLRKKLEIQNLNTLLDLLIKHNLHIYLDNLNLLLYLQKFTFLKENNIDEIKKILTKLEYIILNNNILFFDINSYEHYIKNKKIYFNENFTKFFFDFLKKLSIKLININITKNNFTKINKLSLFLKNLENNF